MDQSRTSSIQRREIPSTTRKDPSTSTTRSQWSSDRTRTAGMASNCPPLRSSPAPLRPGPAFRSYSIGSPVVNNCQRNDHKILAYASIANVFLFLSTTTCDHVFNVDVCNNVRHLIKNCLPKKHFLTITQQFFCLSTARFKSQILVS